jgi:hypothetical protein
MICADGGTPLPNTTTDEEHSDYGRECVRLAGLTQNPYIRSQLLEMARDWMAVAIHAEMTKSKTPAQDN